MRLKKKKIQNPVVELLSSGKPAQSALENEWRAIEEHHVR
jgi:hypothetical protein